MRRLPAYIGGGPTVSELAYQIVCVWLDPTPRPNIPAIDYLAAKFDVDEADVLRALAELERVGVLEVQR